MMGESIHILAIASPLGPLQLTERDGHLVSLDWNARGDGEPAAATPLLMRARAALTAYFAGRRTDFDLPCDPTGTPFQRRVWAEMARIPFGTTITYGELARRIGSSPRAVGNACGANPLPIVLPCHRVLSASGLGGYSGFGGADTKAWLLAHESREPSLFKSRLAS